MTFKHKLSVRLALLKDVLPVVPMVALLAACEQPSLVGPPIKTSINVSTIVTLPDSITLDPGQTRQFASYGRTPDGDSVAINVTWQAVGGGLCASSGPGASVGGIPAWVSVSVGSTQQLRAGARAAGGKVLPGRTAPWGSSSSAIATVSPKGIVSGLAVRSATITATSEGKSATAA